MSVIKTAGVSKIICIGGDIDHINAIQINNVVAFDTLHDLKNTITRSCGTINGFLNHWMYQFGATSEEGLGDISDLIEDFNNFRNAQTIEEFDKVLHNFIGDAETYVFLIPFDWVDSI